MVASIEPILSRWRKNVEVERVFQSNGGMDHIGWNLKDVAGYVPVAFIGPITEQWLADQFVPRDKSPITTVIAVVAIVAHHKITVCGNLHWAIVVPDL